MKATKVLSLFTKRNKTQKRNIKIKTKMTEVMSENKDVVKYQWKKGDNFGKVVEVQSTDDQFVNFTDGSRIFKNVLNEFLEKVQGENLPLPGADQAAAKLSGNDVPQTGHVQDNTPTVSTNASAPVVTQAKVKEPSVMGKMIMKMSKKNIVNVPIQINLNIPTPALHAMLAESMEEEDLNDEITDVAFSQIEMDKLQEYIKDSVSDFLSQYYS